MIAKKAVVGGYICLDVTPDLSSVPVGQFKALLQPGRVIQSGDVQLTAGGVVSNTGLALHRFGVPVQLIGKIGDDLFGQATRNIIHAEAEQLVDDLIVDPSAPTAYSIILNPPGFDRTFLHFNGANDMFYASDLSRKILQEADLFHFGYPPSMRSIFRGEGGELVSIMQRARRAGLTTSLDFSHPDPSSTAGKVDWTVILANSLPFVDLFVPSVEELTFLLRRKTYDQLSDDPAIPFLDAVTPDLLNELSEIVLGYGVKVAMIKIGQRGVYLRTAKSEAWQKGGRGVVGLDETWHNRTLWAPAFKVESQGTTGAGDAAIAGFLASLLRGTDLETAALMAAAAGANRVETLEGTSGLASYEDLLDRVRRGWETLPLDLTAFGWRKDGTSGLWQK